MRRVLGVCESMSEVRRNGLGVSSFNKWSSVSVGLRSQKTPWDVAIGLRMFHSSRSIGMGGTALSHVNAQGSARMVDVINKPVSERVAIAEAVVDLGEKAYVAVKDNQLKKGSVLDVAEIAGIQGAKLTSSLIPLCHNISLTHVDVNMELVDQSHSVRIIVSAQACAKTGVEMEALTAATVAALTVYDMCKAVSKGIVIREVKLLKKTGGQKGDYEHTCK